MLPFDPQNYVFDSLFDLSTNIIRDVSYHDHDVAQDASHGQWDKKAKSQQVF